MKNSVCPTIWQLTVRHLVSTFVPFVCSSASPPARLQRWTPTHSASRGSPLSRVEASASQTMAAESRFLSLKPMLRHTIEP
ncbi:hypothetical protein BD289DRAFT_431111 [Coniella lustricola]|uniref:Uncharacterized protein n=1 Tax=Coniella lustricola TaxID=2025994 RepID=A0A2T3ABF7_9PEZI|nr:hypothetical protein BD289DRAFT_431111 [Coniella lustricola]